MQIKRLKKDVENIKVTMQQQEEELKVMVVALGCVGGVPCEECVCPMQERTEDVDQRRTAMDKASREYAQLKLRRDDLTNQRK